MRERPIETALHTGREHPLEGAIALLLDAASQHPRANTGMTVSVTTSAPISAKIVVSAIGPNSRPEGPEST